MGILFHQQMSSLRTYILHESTHPTHHRAQVHNNAAVSRNTMASWCLCSVGEGMVLLLLVVTFLRVAVSIKLVSTEFLVHMLHSQQHSSYKT